MATNFGTKLTNSIHMKNNCALFALTPLFLGLRYLMVSFEFLPWLSLLPWQQILGQKLNITQPMWKIIMRCFYLHPCFRARAIRWCHLNFSPANPCCHGNEFWDKIDYNLAPVKDNCTICTYPTYTQLLGYIAWQWTDTSVRWRDTSFHRTYF